MDKPPFSQTVVGVVVLGALTWIVGGLALKWVTDSRIVTPSRTSIGAPAQAPGRLFDDQTQTAAISPSEMRPASTGDTSTLPVRASGHLSDANYEKRKINGERDQPAATQARSQPDHQRRAAYDTATHLPSKVEFLVCAATAARAPMGAFTTALTEHLNARGKAASGFVFSPEFVTAGAFDLFFVGRGGRDLQDMPVSSMGRNIFLARVSNSVKPGTSAAGLFTASVVVAFSVLSSNDGSVVDGFELTAAGAGTSETDAVSRALDRILDLLGHHGY